MARCWDKNNSPCGIETTWRRSVETAGEMERQSRTRRNKWGDRETVGEDGKTRVNIKNIWKAEEMKVQLEEWRDSSRNFQTTVNIKKQLKRIKKS